MQIDLIAAFCLFAVVTAATPGPITMMALASGANSGLRRTMPFVLGVGVGISTMVLAIGFGLNAVFQALPWLYDTLRYLGAAYLVFLALRIARSGPIRSQNALGPPIGFLGAMVFQWINPKGWAITISAVAIYAPHEGFTKNVILIAMLFGLILMPCVSAWAAFGNSLRGFLSAPKSACRFNYAMAALLIASLVPILIGW